MGAASGLINVNSPNTTLIQFFSGRFAWCVRKGILSIVFLIIFSPASIAQETAGPSTADQLDNYLMAINEAESNGGPYAIELVDLYYGFGKALMDDGDLEAALDAFQQTAIITRVNHGPNSIEQASYLYSVAKVESLLGRLEPAVRVLEYIYQLHAREYGENSPDMLPLIDELKQWYQDEKPLQALHSRSTDFQNMSFLASRKSALTAAQFGRGSREAADAYRQQGQSHFRAILYMFRTGDPPIPELVINGGTGNHSWVAESSISDHFRSGEYAFEQVIQSWRNNPEATVLDVAEAIAQLGDWYLVLEQFRSAGKQYKKAYQLLASNGETRGIADEYFGVPTPLRFHRSNESYTRDFDRAAAEDGIEVIMDVSRNGRLSDIEFRNIPSSETQEDIEKVRARLERTRFRPSIVMGKPRETERGVWKPPVTGPRIASRENQRSLNP